MSYKHTSYVAKPTDEHGIVHYTDTENALWNKLIVRQHKIVQNRACDEYLHGLEVLNLPLDRIPQCNEVSSALQKATGWVLEPVSALIPFEQFFHLLANRRFPAATFIRKPEELDYLQEPDIFHEVFGHCPLLTNPAYADFTHTYGQLGLKANKEDRAMLAKLYWFTIEFGLLKTTTGLRIYGGGILSSANETVSCLENPAALRKPFDLIEVLRTPYRIDIVQPIYFILESFDILYELIKSDLMGAINLARTLGVYDSSFLNEGNAE